MSQNYGRNQFGPFDVFGTPLAAWLGAGARLADIIKDNGLVDDETAKTAKKYDDYTVIAGEDLETGAEAEAAAQTPGAEENLRREETRDELEAGRAALSDTLGEAAKSFRDALSQLDLQLRREGEAAVGELNPEERIDRVAKKLKTSELRGMADAFRNSAEALYDELSERSRDRASNAFGGAARTARAGAESSGELLSAWLSVGKKAAGVAEDLLDLASDEIRDYKSDKQRRYNAEEEAPQAEAPHTEEGTE